MNKMMKTLMLSLSILTIANGSVSASESVDLRDRFASVMKIELDPKSPYPDTSKHNGYVYIGETEVKIELSKEENCRSKSDCKEPPMPSIVFRGELQSAGPNGCGSVIYTARWNEIPVDGIDTTITIVDHSKRTCRDLKRFKTEVRIKEVFVDLGNGGTVVERNHFLGASQLKVKPLR